MRSGFVSRFSESLAQIVALFLGLSVASGLMLSDAPMLKSLRHAVFDQFQRWHPRPYSDTAVRIVDIDEASLARIGQWPWPRTKVAELLQTLHAAAPAAVGFDVLFTEPDRTSPEQVLPLWPLGSGERAALAQLPRHDEVLAQALAGKPVVLGFAPTTEEQEGEPGSTQQQAPARYRYVQLGDAPSQLARYPSATLPLPVLARNAAGIGALAFSPDGDGIVRRVPLVSQVGTALAPSFTAELLRVGLGETNYLVRSTATGGGLQSVRIGPLTVPTTASGEAWVHFSQRREARTIPAWKVLAGDVPASELQGRLLLVGSSAPGLMDLRFSPLGEVNPGVEVHAQFLEQALSGQFLQRPDLLVGIELLAMLIGSLVAVVAVLLLPPLGAAALTACLLGALAASAWIAFRQHGLLLDPLTPGLAIMLNFFVAGLLRYQRAERQRRWVSQAFSRYVSPNLVSHILRNPEQLELGGHREVCSFVFTDLAGYTALMEKIEPTLAVRLLNDYLNGMVTIAFEHEGTLDRIVGDALAIMFSAPMRQADHRQRAFDCALALQKFSFAFAQAQQANGIPFGHTRIGVHSGEVTVGNFGGGTIFDYRALGDPVNTASRLEALNKRLGTRVCISEDSLNGCRPAAVREIGRVLLAGKTEALRVYQPWHDGLEGTVDASVAAAYDAAMALLRAGSEDALDAFEELARQHPEDGLVRFHDERLRSGGRGDLLEFGEK